MKKVRKFIYIMALIVISFQFILGIKSVKASEIGDIQYLERSNKGFYSIQKWNGSEWIYVIYSITHYTDKDGIKKVAYCIDPDLKGIGWISGEYEGYDVQIKELLSDERLWRIYTNGYPYKTPSDLGVETEEDAYLATKMASYAILRSNTADDIRRDYRAGLDKVAGQSLEDTERRGTKVIDAICNLINVGYYGSETPQYNNILSICESSDFSQDCIKKDYYSQTFTVESKVECDKYKVTEINNFPEGSYVANVSGEEKYDFYGSEDFKIMIPESSIKEDINGQINIEGVCKNYPIYYGECKIGNYQNYMLCCDTYSNNIKASGNVNIRSDNSKIIVKKIDKDSKLPIEGVQFSVMYEDGRNIGTYETDENGIIDISNIKPGNVIIKELKTKEPYTLNKESLRLFLGYNETKEITVENEKKKGGIKIIKVDSNNTEIRIPGVKFDIVNSNNELVAQIITNENGEAEVNNLPIDTKYTIKEIETSEGYILTDEPVTVTLNENEIKNLTFKNKKKKIEKSIEENIENVETLPKTGETDIGNYLLGTCISGIALDCSFIKKVKKGNRRNEIK